MTVRFESGYSVTYNEALQIQWALSRDGFHVIRTKSGGRLIAMVPGSCLIEWESPCIIDKPHECTKIDDVISGVQSLKSQIKKLRSELKPKTKKRK